MTAPLRILVVDDEPLARQRLLDLLDEEEDVEVVGAVGTGRAAVQAIGAGEPDVVFLDVQMPGMSGLDVIREVGPDAMPVTVFVTAYDQHALAAFDLSALDYLLKPFEDQRFRQALDRARRIAHLREVDALQERLLTLLQEEATPAASAEPASAEYLERIAVDMRGQVRIVPVERIDFITSDGPYAELHVGEDTFVIRERMRTLEERLDPSRFVRIHRSTIVQLDRVEVLLVGSGGDYAVRLKDGSRLRVSRSRYEALANRLGLDALG